MDLNVRAFRVVQAAISEDKNTETDAKREASRRGGLVGGPARARAISRRRRIEIAKKASSARWNRQRTARKRVNQGDHA